MISNDEFLIKRSRFKLDYKYTKKGRHDVGFEEEIKSYKYGYYS